jgi:hypothetical protein
MDSKLGNLYPEVLSAGSLRAAVVKAADRVGCCIGPLDGESYAVSVETERGVISINLAADERLFLIGINSPGFIWAAGATDDLELLVQAVAAWHEGASAEAFQSEFSFMQLGEFARALEAGDPTPLQWSELLSSDFHSKQRNLLTRIHADAELRQFFPTITHGVVRLRVDALDGGSRQVLVDELDKDRYAVKPVGQPGAAWVEVAGAHLVEYLREHLWRE